MEWVSIMHLISLSQAIASVEEIELVVKFLCRPPIQHSGTASQGDLDLDRGMPFPRENLRAIRGSKGGDEVWHWGRSSQFDIGFTTEWTMILNLLR